MPPPLCLAQAEFSDRYDAYAPPVGLDMAGHDTFLMGPKAVILDSFIVDLLHVDTSAQTFRLKLLLNMDWEDDGIIEPEFKAKRNLGRTGSSKKQVQRGSMESICSTTTNGIDDAYRTGKYVLKQTYRDENLPLASENNYPEGSVAMANSGPNTNGSQFFLVYKDTTLGPNYTLWGKIVSGLEIVTKLAYPDEKKLISRSKDLLS